MNGTILHFRQNRHTTRGNHMLIEVKGVDSREKASKLVGKKVTYDTGKNTLTGKIASAHGNSGVVRVIFERGMPGQSIGQSVTIA